MHSTPEVEGRFRWWDEALRRAYFAQPGKPCVLAVDGDELARMAPDLEDAAADLTRAVRRVAGIPSSSDYFPGTTERYEKWKKHGCEGLPPVLPLLALSVLAATRMHGSGPYSRSNYYIRLSELLAAAGAPGSVEEIRYQVQRRFGSVAGMWRDLHEYLRRHPEHGESTIREHPSLTIIGYPLSQALVRKSDRAVLTHFFSKLALGAQRDIPGDSLLATLRLWASRPRGFSDPFVRAIRDDEVKALVLPIVLGLMHSWDGRVLGPEGAARSLHGSRSIRIGGPHGGSSRPWPRQVAPSREPLAGAKSRCKSQGEKERRTPHWEASRAAAGLSADLGSSCGVMGRRWSRDARDWCFSPRILRSVPGSRETPCRRTKSTSSPRLQTSPRPFARHWRRPQSLGGASCGSARSRR